MISLGAFSLEKGGTEDSTLGMGSLVPLMHHDKSDLELICLVKKCKIHFSI